MLDKSKIKCFLSLSKTLNFSRSAEELFLTQQAVSKRITALEKEIGLTLFERTTRSVRLTEAGAALAAFLERYTEEYDAKLNELRKKQKEDLLLVGYQNFLIFSNDTLNDALRRLRELCPSITLVGNCFNPPVLNQMLSKKQLDIIIIYERFLYPFNDVETLDLLSVPQYMMVADSHPCVTAQEMRTQPFIIESLDGESPKAFEARLMRDLALFRLSPSDVLIAPDRDSAYTYAELGRGVVIGPRISRLAANRTLRLCDSGYAEKLLAVWKRNAPNPMTARYAELLRRSFEASPLPQGYEKVSDETD